MACRELQVSWKEYLNDPSQTGDSRSSKRGPRPPSFRNGRTRKPLWIAGSPSLPCSQEDWTRSRMKDGELYVWHARGKDAAHPEFHDCTALLNLIKGCGNQKNFFKGNRIHADILKTGLLRTNIHVGTALLRMYSKCGALAKAHEVFDELPAWDVVSWNALITGYVEHGLSNEALKYFGRMRDEGLFPDAFTFVCILKACGSIGAIERGEEIYAEVKRQGLLQHNVVLGTALVDMYCKCGALAKAREVFDELPVRNVISWNVLIAGYAQHGLGDEAVNCLTQMQDEGFFPDAITFVYILKACGNIKASEKGKEIHAEVRRQGLLDKDIVLGTSLVDMYAKCGVLTKAQEVFDELPARDVASWNALIAGYAEHGLGDEALSCFGCMRDEGLFPNAVTFVCVLKSCSSIGAVKKGGEIHVEVSRQGLLEKSTELGTALVDMYAKCGALAKAQEVFDELPARDVTSWTALIAGYAEHGLGDEALNCFGQMHDEGLSPDTATFICILKACGSIGATEKGEEIHAEVNRQGLLEKYIGVGVALVDVYAKCGMLAKAQEVFDEIPSRDVVSWTALIAGYAQLGEVQRVFYSFSKMIGEGIEPNVITFVVLLNACSHAGLVEEGQMCFDTMTSVYSIIPTLEHHTCMVDLFSRAGHFDKAINLIEKVPSSDRLLLWSAFLGSCLKWVNVELGKWAFEQAIHLDENYGPVYACMSNVYASAGMQE